MLRIVELVAAVLCIRRPRSKRPIGLVYFERMRVYKFDSAL